MRAATTTATFGLILLLLLLGSALAVPSQLATIIDKRQVGGRGGSGRDLSRPSAWDDLPELPAAMSDAYERNAMTETLQLLIRAESEDSGSEAVTAMAALKVRATYATDERVETLLVGFLSELIENRERGTTSDRDVLEDRLSALTLPQLEREMAEMVRFRQEHEEVGSPGQESYRYPPEHTSGPTDVLPSPFLSLCILQDRQLIVAKARSGGFTRGQLYEYLISQDPFLADFAVATYAQDLVISTIRDYQLR